MNDIYQEQIDFFKQLAEHWELMYKNLMKQHEDLFREYDKLVMKKIEKELKNA